MDPRLVFLFEEYKKLKVGHISPTRVYKNVVARKLM